jgi:hypothetical protein
MSEPSFYGNKDLYKNDDIRLKKHFPRPPQEDLVEWTQAYEDAINAPFKRFADDLNARAHSQRFYSARVANNHAGIPNNLLQPRPVDFSMETLHERLGRLGSATIIPTLDYYGHFITEKF